MKSVIRPKSLKTAKDVKALTLEEEKILIKRLLENSDNVYALVFLTQLYTGWWKLGLVLSNGRKVYPFSKPHLMISSTASTL